MTTSGTDTSPKTADPIQDAVYSRVLMATMAGRRTMVVTDYTGGNGALPGRRMADYMSSSGGMALTATGYRGATFEDILTEAAAGIGLKRTGDLEELALALERTLDTAGSSLLVVFDAHLLSAPVIGELFELSASNTESGLYMQVLLTGGPGLDAQFDKPGLANVARQVASSRWRIEAAIPAEEQPESHPVQPAARKQPAFSRRRTDRRDDASALEQVFEPRPVRESPRVKAYAVPPDTRLGARQHYKQQHYPQAARSSRRIYLVLAFGILFAFAAGFVTNALWPFAPKSATELLKGDGRSALTASLPSPPPVRPVPAEPQAQLEPEPIPPAPPHEPPAPTVPIPPPVPTPPPATQPAPHAAPLAPALPPEWNQPVERPRPSSTRNAPAPSPERPAPAAPTPLTPQSQQVQSQQAQLPPEVVQQPAVQQPARAVSPMDVCRQGADAAKPPPDSLSGIAEGFMTDLRNLGRCLNGLAR
jgi:hypothetical protein